MLASSLGSRQHGFFTVQWLSVRTNLIDKIEMMYNDIDPLQMYHCCAKLLDKIKAERASGLTNDDAAELTTGNLIFKSLRRSGHIEKLIDIKRRCFDRARSIK